MSVAPSLNVKIARFLRLRDNIFTLSVISLDYV